MFRKDHALLLLSTCVLLFVSGCGFGPNALVHALHEKDRRAIHAELHKITNPNYRVQYKSGWYFAPLPILTIAVYEGDMEAVTWLLQKGADINGVVPDHASRYWPGGLTALHAATDVGHSGMVELLLRRGADPNAKVRTMFGTPDSMDLHKLQGLTPLMTAALRGHRDVVKVLLAGGAAPDQKEITSGQTSLQLAEARGSKEIAWLIRRADVGNFAHERLVTDALHYTISGPAASHTAEPLHSPGNVRELPNFSNE
jgi:hypothetical protein